MAHGNDTTDYSITEIHPEWRVYADTLDDAHKFLQERVDEDPDFDGAIINNDTGKAIFAYLYNARLVAETELDALRADVAAANERADAAERERDAALESLRLIVNQPIPDGSHDPHIAVRNAVAGLAAMSGIARTALRMYETKAAVTTSAAGATWGEASPVRDGDIEIDVPNIRSQHPAD